MDDKINFTGPFKYIKYTVSYIKSAIGKAFTLYNKTKRTSIDHHKIKILNKAIKSHTWAANGYFIIIVIALCLLTLVISYYEQYYKLKQQLAAKTELAHSRIEKTIKAYHLSLTSLEMAILKNQRYLEAQKILQVLKLAYTTDENIRLLPVTWHPLPDSSTSFNVHGNVIATPDQQLMERLDNNESQQLLIYEQLDKQNEPNLIICYAVIQPSSLGQNNLENENKKNLIGYFIMSVKTSLLLQSLYDNFDNDALLRITNRNQTIYFNKQKNIFQNTNVPDQLLNEYQFADEITFSVYPYKIAVGKNTQYILIESLKITGIRCGIIITIGAILLMLYNRIERKKALKLCSDNNDFIEENYSLKQQVLDLTEKLDKADYNNKNLAQQNHGYKVSAEMVTEIERKIHQSSRIIIGKMRDHNNLLVKHCNKQQELDNERIENIGNSFHEASVDLLNNVVNKKDDITEVAIEEMIDEVLDIYSPLIATNLIIIKKDISKKYRIHTNELILKQVLISLFARSIYLLAEKSTIYISTQKTIVGNRLHIEISDNGFGFDEDRFNRFLNEGKKDLLPGFIHIQLDLLVINKLVKEILSGTLNANNKNKLILSLPFPTEYGKPSNIIPFPQ